MSFNITGITNIEKPIEFLFNINNNNPNSPEFKEFLHYKHEYLKFRMNMPLDMKVEYSLNRIRAFYKYYNGDVYVAFSGGKDSVVLLDLVRSVYPGVVAIFCDTGVEFPETRDFVRGCNKVEIIRPSVMFKDVLRDYGYPVVSKEQSSYIREVRKYGKNSKIGKMRLTGKDYNGKTYGAIYKKWQFLIDAPFKVSEECCYKLKKEPFYKLGSERGIFPFIGLTSGESRSRRGQWIKFGCNIYGENGAGRPLMFWREDDVLEYVRRRGLRLSKVYDMGYRRTGCIYCMFGLHLESQKEGINRFERLKVTHRKLWEYAIGESGLGLGKIMDYCKFSYGR